MIVRSSSIFSKAPVTLAAINAAIAGGDITPASIQGINAVYLMRFGAMDGGSAAIVPTPGTTDITPTEAGIYSNLNDGKLYWFDGVTHHEIAFV